MEEIAIKPKYKENLMLLQANELVRSRQDELTILEARLIRLAIAQIVKSDTDLKTYTCSLSELSKFLQIPKSDVYREVIKLKDSLLKKIITIYKQENDILGNVPFKSFHWVDTIEYENGQVIIKLSDSLKPYLLGLEQFFTMYGYETLLNLPTNNSIRMFELLMSWQNKPYSDLVFFTDTFEIENDEVAFTLEYLRQYFNCKDKYPNAGDFIKKVIDKSIEFINKNTIMKVSYRKIKKGTKIEYIIFKYITTEIDKEFQDKMRDARLLVEKLNEEFEAQMMLEGDF